MPLGLSRGMGGVGAGGWPEFESELGGEWVELGQEDGVGAGTGSWLGEVTRSCLFP